MAVSLIYLPNSLKKGIEITASINAKGETRTLTGCPTGT